MRAWRAQRGYTTLELVVVLALMGILLTLGAASFRGALAREEADGWVRSIVYDIAAGQQAAFTRRTRVTATFFADGTFSIIADSGGTNVVLRQDTLPDHMTFGSTDSVTFNRRGVPVDGSLNPLSRDWTMTVSSTSGRSYTITVQASTGRVSYND